MLLGLALQSVNLFLRAVTPSPSKFAVMLPFLLILFPSKLAFTPIDRRPWHSRIIFLVFHLVKPPFPFHHFGDFEGFPFLLLGDIASAGAAVNQIFLDGGTSTAEEILLLMASGRL